MSETELPEITVGDVERALKTIADSGISSVLARSSLGLLWALDILIVAAGYWLADETAYLSFCGVSEDKAGAFPAEMED